MAYSVKENKSLLKTASLEIVEVEATLQTTANISQTYSETTIPLPEGFTFDNTRVLSVYEKSQYARAFSCNPYMEMGRCSFYATTINTNKITLGIMATDGKGFTSTRQKVIRAILMRELD